MKFTLSLRGVKPITLNHAIKYRSIGNRGIQGYKSADYKHLIELCYHVLREPKNHQEIARFNNKYDAMKHRINMSYSFAYPIITKKKTVSMRSGDLSNLVKPIEDIIFKELSADDSQVCKLEVIKYHSDEPYILITIELVEFA